MTESINITQNINEITVTQQSNNAIISSVGIQGAQGPKGDTGSPGSPGSPGAPGANGTSGGFFVFEQQTNSTIWNITHNLGYRPAVTIQDYGTITLEGNLGHIDANNLVLTFSQAVSGYAYLS
jgi:hypothetical protein